MSMSFQVKYLSFARRKTFTVGERDHWEEA
jgi:hypothetical protein